MEENEYMAKMRVHELAKELDIKSQDIIEVLSTTEYAVKSAQSGLEEPAQEIVRSKYAKKEAAKAEAPKSETAKTDASEEHKERPKKKSSITAVFNAQYSKQQPKRSNDRNGERPDRNGNRVDRNGQTRNNDRNGENRSMNRGPRQESYAARPQQIIKPRPVGERAMRPISERTKDNVDDFTMERPSRPQNERPQGQKPNRDGSERPSRPQGERPQGNRPNRNFGDRPERSDRNERNDRNDRNSDRNFRNKDRFNKDSMAAPVVDDVRGKESRERGNNRNNNNNKRYEHDKLGGKHQENYINLEKHGGKKKHQPQPQKPKEDEDTIKTLVLPEKIVIRDLADKMKVQPSAIVKNLFMKGQMVTVNHEVTFEEAEEIALEFNFICEPEEKIDVIAELLKE